MIPYNRYNQGSNFVQAYVEQQKNELQNQEVVELRIPKINRENKPKKQQQIEQENFQRKFDSLMRLTFLNLNELVITRLKYGFKQIKQQKSQSMQNKIEQSSKNCKQMQILVNALKKFEIHVILQNAAIDMPFILEQLKNPKEIEPKTLQVKVAFLKMKYIYYKENKTNYQMQYLIQKEKEFGSLLIYKILDYKIKKLAELFFNRILEKVYKNNQMAITICSKAQRITQQKYTQNLCIALKALFQTKVKSSFSKIKEYSIQMLRTNNLIELKLKEYFLRAEVLSKTLKSLIKRRLAYSFQKIQQLQAKCASEQLQNNIIQYEEKFDLIIKDYEAQIDMSIIKTQALVNQEAENKLLRAKQKYFKTLNIVKHCRFLQIVSKYLQKRKQKCFIQFQNNTIIKMIQKMSKLKEQLMDKINDINLNLECQSEQERIDNWIIDYNKYLYMRRQKYQTAIQEAQIQLQNEEQDFLLTIQQMEQLIEQEPIDKHIFLSEINPQTLQSLHNLSMQHNEMSIQNTNNNLSSQNNIVINS